MMQSIGCTLFLAEPSKKVLMEKISSLVASNPVLTDLAESAPIMEEIAKNCCRGSYLNHGSCEWYHGSWQYLRMLDAVSTPDWHGNFYKTNIFKLFSGKGEIEVLICGLADYGILSHVLEGCHIAKIEPHITLFDACQTPLEICSWYLKKHFPNTRTYSFTGDVTDSNFPLTTYDLIITDAFLTRFDKSDRTKIVDSWKKSLKPDGSIITTARIDNHAVRIPIRANPRSVNSFADKAWGKAIERAGLLLPKKAIK
jgi:SAM-dependent methyltransferase